MCVNFTFIVTAGHYRTKCHGKLSSFQVPRKSRKYNYKVRDFVFITVQMGEVYHAMHLEFPGLPKAAKVAV